MGSFRFRRRVRIAPGLTLNLNRRSVSLTGGIRGAHVTRSSTGRTSWSAGLPGTGLSYRGGSRRSAMDTERPPALSLTQELAQAPVGTKRWDLGNVLAWLGGFAPVLFVAWIISLATGGLWMLVGVIGALWTVLWWWTMHETARSAR